MYSQLDYVLCSVVFRNILLELFFVENKKIAVVCICVCVCICCVRGVIATQYFEKGQEKQQEELENMSTNICPG